MLNLMSVFWLLFFIKVTQVRVKITQITLLYLFSVAAWFLLNSTMLTYVSHFTQGSLCLIFRYPQATAPGYPAYPGYGAPPPQGSAPYPTQPGYAYPPQPGTYAPQGYAAYPSQPAYPGQPGYPPQGPPGQPGYPPYGQQPYYYPPSQWSHCVNRYRAVIWEWRDSIV